MTLADSLSVGLLTVSQNAEMNIHIDKQKSAGGAAGLQAMDKLTEDELNQLKTLLIRYLVYHAEGFFNKAVDALLA